VNGPVDHELRRRALDVLERNRRGDWTCPSGALYPHQWLWDSCFVAIGLARHDPHRAADELRALLRGQWSNGMLPHMIFAPGSHDVGSRRVWQSRRHPEAPRDVETSCITQPPLLAIAARHVAAALPTHEGRAFLAELHPRLVAHHQWLYRERDLNGRGLVTLIHPWESGLDSTPPWMRALAAMPAPWWLRLALRAHLARVVRSLRRDTRLVPAAERASDDDGLRMLVLAHRIRRCGFELRRMPLDRIVPIEDLAFNAFLVVANRALAAITEELGLGVDPELARSSRRTEAALEELWDEDAGCYRSRHAGTGELLPGTTVATLLPLWAGTASDERTARLVALLRQPSGFWPAHPVPSVPADSPDFEPDRYWKGPTWVNVNWAIVQGLRERGETDLAEELVRCTLAMVEVGDCHEYFSALTGRGFGADDFSWTAALVLDLLEPPRSPSSDAG
jgi:hypothetical protein